MKSKDEILRKNNYLDEDGFIDINAIHKSMEEYATQCQEDMSDKKYTEEDMLKCWNACLDFNKPAGFDSGINFKDFINSLNKQN